MPTMKVFDDRIEVMFDALARAKKMNQFLESLKDWWDINGWLTERQFECLEENYEEL